MEKKEHEEAQEGTQIAVWGYNSSGQLACDNTQNNQVVEEPKILFFNIHIIDIACGYEHTMMKSIEGNIYTTGGNSKG